MMSEQGVFIGQEQAQLSEGGYTWGGTQKALTEGELEAAKQNTHGSILVVDYGSSVPTHPEMLTADYREECLDQAQRIVGGLVNTLLQDSTKRNSNYFFELDKESRTTINHAITEHSALSRQLLTGVIYDILLNPPFTEDNQLRRAFLEAYIREHMKTSIRTYDQRWERAALVGQGRWKIIESEDTITTFESEVRDRFNGNTNLNPFFQNVARYLAYATSPKLRPFRAVSVDIENLDTLAKLSQTKFPEDYRNTVFFKRACSRYEDHIQGDMFQQIFGRENVTFFSSFEGWPFYFGNLPLEQHLQFAQKLADELKTGGRGVIFPWIMHENTIKNLDVLNALEALWESVGLRLSFESYTSDKLKRDMTPRELELAKRSPVFTRYYHDKLVIEKPSSQTMPVTEQVLLAFE